MDLPTTQWGARGTGTSLEEQRRGLSVSSERERYNPQGIDAAVSATWAAGERMKLELFQEPEVAALAVVEGEWWHG